MVIIFCEQKTKKDETILILSELTDGYAISRYFIKLIVIGAHFLNDVTFVSAVQQNESVYVHIHPLMSQLYVHIRPLVSQLYVHIRPLVSQYMFTYTP